MDIRTFQKGDVIFRQGEQGECMYAIVSGTVGIYKEFETPYENKIAELGNGDFLGEMELVENMPRSATAVVLSESAELDRITDQNYLDFFTDNPVQVYLIMKQLSERLRETTKNYAEACRTVYETVKTAESGKEPDADLLSRQQRFCMAHERRMRE